MDAPAALREQLEIAQSLLESTIEGVNDLQFHAKPSGEANPIGQNYLHAVVAEDFVVNGMFKRGTPLHSGEWAGRTGSSVSIPMPMQGAPEWHVFIETANIDLPAFKAYAQAVHQSALDWVGSLSPADLDHQMELQMIGTRSLNWSVFNFLIGHMANHTGEISALKGVVGLKGYPF
jgi:hypothetical protein